MKNTMRLSILLLSRVLLAIPASAAFPTFEGPVFPPGDDGTVGDSIGNQENVHVAAGGSGFLVVWTDMRTSDNAARPRRHRARADRRRRSIHD